MAELRNRKSALGAELASPLTKKKSHSQKVEKDQGAEAIAPQNQKTFSERPSCTQRVWKITKKVLKFLAVFLVVASLYLAAIPHGLIKYRIDGISLPGLERIFKCGPKQTFYTDFHFGANLKTPYQGRSADDIAEHPGFLEEKRKVYQFAEPEEFLGFPPSIANFKDVICEQGFPFPESLKFWSNLRMGKFNSLIALVMAKIQGWKDFSAYDYMFKSPFFAKKPERLYQWESDEFFSKQRLSGINPVVLKKATEIPSKLNLDLSRVTGFLESGVTIEKALAAGRLYIEDYELLDGIKAKPGYNIYPSISLHYVNNRKVLMPIAIQLNQKGDESFFGTYYPDEGSAWLFAKVASQVNYVLHHQIVTHLLKTHLLIEVWTIAMHRNMLPDHPLYILMEDYLQQTMAINQEARDVLLPQIIDQITTFGIDGSKMLADKAYKSYNFSAAGLKTDLKARAVWDDQKFTEEQDLPGYDYRDFALPLWDAMEQMVSGIVDVFYLDDLAVRTDVSLQHFVADVAVAGKMRGFPNPMNSKDELVHTLTMIMFTASVQHSAINYIQYDYLAYAPSSPPALIVDQLPASKSQMTREWLFTILPGMIHDFEQVATVWALSSPPMFKEELITSPTNWKLPAAKKVADQFVSNLKKIGQNMAAINENRGQFDKYTVLYPDRVPKSTMI